MTLKKQNKLAGKACRQSKAELKKRVDGSIWTASVPKETDTTKTRKMMKGETMMMNCKEKQMNAQGKIGQEVTGNQEAGENRDQKESLNPGKEGGLGGAQWERAHTQGPAA